MAAFRWNDKYCHIGRTERGWKPHTGNREINTYTRLLYCSRTDPAETTQKRYSFTSCIWLPPAQKHCFCSNITAPRGCHISACTPRSLQAQHHCVSLSQRLELNDRMLFQSNTPYPNLFFWRKTKTTPNHTKIQPKPYPFMMVNNSFPFFKRNSSPNAHCNKRNFLPLNTDWTTPKINTFFPLYCEKVNC